MKATGWTPSARLKQIAIERAQPLSASLELTYRCNWRCVFCYNPRHHDKRGLSGREWLGVLDDLRALGTLYVSLTGGEPLTHPEFFAIARGVRERAFALRILSNAALITDKVADKIADLNPIAVETSLHGSRPETHDRATATPGSFTAFFRGLDRLQERGVSVVVKTPLTRLNEDEIEAIHTLVEARDVPWRLDSVLTPRDDGDLGPLAYRASPPAVENVYRRLAAVGQLPHEERSKGGVNCGVGRTTIAIDPEGNVYPCIQWRKAPMGNVRETALRELWPGADGRREAAAVSRAANDKLVESGGAMAVFPFCPALAYQNTGDPLQPDDRHREEAEMAERVRRSTG
ncbi:MAG: radical SAM protein [Acidobacteriota bacterium]